MKNELFLFKKKDFMYKMGWKGGDFTILGPFFSILGQNKQHSFENRVKCISN